MQPDRKGVMDDLISQLKTGDAYAGKRRRKSTKNIRTSSQALNSRNSSIEKLGADKGEQSDAEKLLMQLNS